MIGTGFRVKLVDLEMGTTWVQHSSDSNLNLIGFSTARFALRFVCIILVYICVCFKICIDLSRTDFKTDQTLEDTIGLKFWVWCCLVQISQFENKWHMWYLKKMVSLNCSCRDLIYLTNSNFARRISAFCQFYIIFLLYICHLLPYVTKYILINPSTIFRVILT